METILTSIYSRLKELNINVYDSRPAEFSEFPFIIYSLDETSVNSNPQTLSLVVDLWAKGEDYSNLETLCSKLNAIMTKEVKDVEVLNYRVIKQNENRIPDENLEIKRKRIAFEVRVFNSK